MSLRLLLIVDTNLTGAKTGEQAAADASSAFEQLSQRVEALQAELAAVRAQAEQAGQHSAAAEIIDQLLQ